jgi:RNA polymerase sigma factor (sigma-70 family)
MRHRRDRVSFDTEASMHAAEHPPHISTDELAEEVYQLKQMERVLEDLPAAYRDILLMRIREQLSYEEISARVGLSSKTCTQYFYRAIAQVRMKWQQE